MVYNIQYYYISIYSNIRTLNPKINLVTIYPLIKDVDCGTNTFFEKEDVCLMCGLIMRKMLYLETMLLASQLSQLRNW